MIDTIIKFLDRKITAKPYELLKNITSLLIGYFSSQVGFFNGSYPLSSAFCASFTSPMRVLLCGIGSVIGLVVPTINESAMYYISAIAIIVFLKLLTELAFSTLNLTHSSVWYSAIGLSCSTIFTLLSTTVETQIVFRCFADVIISLASAYFISNVIEISKSNPTFNSLTATEQISLFAVISTLLLCINIHISSVSIANALALLLIITISYCSDEISAVISSTVFCVILCVMQQDYSNIILFSSTGLLGALVCNKSKPACVATLFVSYILTMTAYNKQPPKISLLVQTVVIPSLFILIPKQVFDKISKIFSQKPLLAKTDALRRDMVNRMNFASSALREVSKTVNTAAEQLSKINLPTLSAVFDSTRNQICSNCTFEKNCFGKLKNTTMSAFKEICNLYRNNRLFDYKSLPKKWSDKCLEPERVANTICTGYENYLSKIQAEQRLQEIRNAVSDQMDMLSCTLKDLSIEFDSYEQYDVIHAQKTESSLRRMGFKPIDVSCRVDSNNRMTVEISVRKSDIRSINKTALINRVTAVCGREFDLPIIADSGNYVLITICEKTMYKVDFGAAQHSYKNSKLCGDTFSHFNDSKGNSITLLSDGMGSGGRACVDSTMMSGLMSRLLLAGFGFNSALRLVNSAMLFKSSDESLATVDITSIDLFTGKAVFYKAGACESTIIRGNKVTKANCKNLPAGILREVNFDVSETKLSEGDLIIMISDGALYDDDDRIEEVAKKICRKSAQEIAEIILDNVISERNDGHEDDITIIVIKLQKEI